MTQQRLSGANVEFSLAWLLSADVHQSDKGSRRRSLDGETLVVKYQPLYSRVTANADAVALHFAQLGINASADHKAAMVFLPKRTEPFRVRDLPRLTPAQQTQLARILITSGFLVRLPDHLAAAL